MRTNLSSQISLNHVSPRYYKPENAVERSVLTRLEKIPTDIFETIEEGVRLMKLQPKFRNASVKGNSVRWPSVPALHCARCLQNSYADIKMKD